jgi:D-alanyl-D-alanine carboxypeptidase
MRPELHFRAGSVAKSLVVTVVLQLVAEARLSLHDPLVRWLPELLPYGDHVTIRQLLNHTGGVPDYAPIVSRTMDGSGQGRFRAWTPQELVALVADQPPSFPPGTSWSYSNTGSVLLGLTVEAATGNRRPPAARDHGQGWRASPESCLRGVPARLPSARHAAPDLAGCFD